MNNIQQSVYTTLQTTLDLDFHQDIKLSIINSEVSINSPLPVNDVATAIFAYLGKAAVTFGMMRGIPSQTITVDRRHAGNCLNGVAWHFQNHWQLDIHVVHSSINGFHQTSDDKYIIYNGAYPHLRNIILDYLNVPNNKDEIKKATAKYSAQTLEDKLSELGACVAQVRDEKTWLAHPQGKILSTTPVIELIKIKESPINDFAKANRPLEK